MKHLALFCVLACASVHAQPFRPPPRPRVIARASRDPLSLRWDVRPTAPISPPRGTPPWGSIGPLRPQPTAPFVRSPESERSFEEIIRAYKGLPPSRVEVKDLPQKAEETMGRKLVTDTLRKNPGPLCQDGMCRGPVDLGVGRAPGATAVTGRTSCCKLEATAIVRPGQKPQVLIEASDHMGRNREEKEAVKTSRENMLRRVFRREVGQ